MSLTRRERVLTAIHHQEPDRVPKGEIDIAPRLVARILGLAEDRYLSEDVSFEDAVSVRKKLEMDLVCVEMASPEPVITGLDTEGREKVRDIWGNIRICEKDKRGIFVPYIREPAIADVQEMREYKFPDIEQFSDANIRRWTVETDFFAFTLLGGVFETARLLCGLEQLSFWLYSNPLELQDFLAKIASFQTELARKAVKAGTHGILISDDVANNKTTFISPSMLRKFFFPPLRRLVESIREAGIPVFLHSDGNINEILPDIVDCGFDGLQSIQPSAGMSLANVKRKYGKRLCLMGNIDLDNLLPFGTPEEVRKVVEETVRIGAAGGGYILSTCNVLTQDIPVENVFAMY
jgi:uroporphyrinogen decarboxylase